MTPDNEMEKIMKIAVSLLAFVVGIIVRGFVVSIGWGWFIVPLGVTPIGFAHALGISVFAAAMTHKIDTNKPEKDGLQMMVEGLIMNVLILGFMWIYQLFM